MSILESITDVDSPTLLKTALEKVLSLQSAYNRKLTPAINLKDPKSKSLGADYEQGNVYAVEYKRGQISDDRKLGSDLRFMVGLLNRIHAHYAD